MKLVVAKKDLESALKTASITVASSGDDLNAYYVFRHTGGVTEILSYNGPVFSSVILAAQVSDLDPEEEVNRFTVEAKRLKTWLGAVSGDILSFTYKNRVVKAKSKRGVVSFRSKDLSMFPWWDDTTSAAILTGKVESSRFLKALEYVSVFISTNESEPDMCVCEFRVGLEDEDDETSTKPRRIIASDHGGLVAVSVAGLENCKARIHGKEVKFYRRFLARCEGEVEVLEHDNCLILRAADGATFGQSRSIHPLPDFVIEDPFTSCHHWWTVGRDDLLAAIKVLSSSTMEGMYKMTLILSDEGDQIDLGVTSMAGGSSTLRIPCQGTRSSSDLDPGEGDLPPTGVPISYKYLSDVVSNIASESFEMGVASLGDEEGYLVFQEEVDGDLRVSMLGWYGEEG
jgi:hypothetical protein